MQKSVPTHSFLDIFPSHPTFSSAGDNWNGKDISINVHEFFYTLEGGIVFYVNGKSYIVPEGYSFYIPEKSVYSCWSVPGKPLVFLNYQFKAETDGEDIFKAFPPDFYGPVIEIPKQKVMDVYHASKHFSSQNIPQRMNTCTQNTKFLLLNYCAVHQRKETERLFGDVLTMMRTRMQEDITLDDMSALRNISPAYFSRKFKEVSGFSPQHFLSRQRLWCAASLIKDKGYSTHQASQAVGFSDMYYFKKFFKSFFGVSPERFPQVFFEPNFVNVKR